MSAKSEYAAAVTDFGVALAAAVSAHDTLRAKYVAAGGVEGSPSNDPPDLRFSALVPKGDTSLRLHDMVSAWQRRVAEASDYFIE